MLVGEQAASSATRPESALTRLMDDLGNFIIAHSEKTDLVAIIIITFIIWAIYMAKSRKKFSLVGALRLLTGILSIAGALVMAAVLLFVQKPDCSKLSSENQMLAGFVTLLAGLAMGGKEFKESFSSKKPDKPDDK